MDAPRSVLGAQQAALSTELIPGQSVVVSGARDTNFYFFIQVPAGLTELAVRTSDGTGDADLYVKRGAEPTTSSYDCRSARATSTEQCVFASPLEGTWMVMVRAYTTLSNVTLVAQTSRATKLTANQPLLVTTTTERFFSLDVPAGKGRVEFSKTGTASVQVKYGEEPTASSGCSLPCSYVAPKAGRYFIRVTNTGTAGTSIMGALRGVVTAPVALTNGQARTSISAAQDDILQYSINVPTGQARLAIDVSWGAVAPVVYLQTSVPFPGSPASCLWPSSSNGSGACIVDAPEAGTYYVALRAPSAFSGVSLLARSVASTSSEVTPLTSGQTVSGLSGSTVQDHVFSIEVPSDTALLKLATTESSGATRLYLQRGAPPAPGQGTYCGTTCTISSPAAGTWYVLLRGLVTYSNLSLTASLTLVTSLEQAVPWSHSKPGPHYLSFDVPEGKTQLEFIVNAMNLTSGRVKFGAIPTSSAYDCYFITGVGGGRESCDFFRPQAGRYYVVLDTTSTPGSLTAQHEGGGPIGTLSDGIPATFSTGPARELRFWKLEVPAGQSRLRVDYAFAPYGGAMLHVKHGDVPASFEPECTHHWSDYSTPGTYGNTCVIDNPRAGTWYVLAASYFAHEGAVRATYAATPVLANGLGERPTSGLQGEEQLWKVEVPAGMSDLLITLSEGTGNADLYVRYGASPDATFDCASTNPTNFETCAFVNPQPGTWYVAVRGAADFAGVAVKAAYAATPGGGVRALANGENVTMLKGAAYSQRLFKIEVPPGQRRLTVGFSQGRGDADLSVRHAARPTETAFDCRSQAAGNREGCAIEYPEPGTWLVRLDGVTDYHSAILTARYIDAIAPISLQLGVPLANVYVGPGEIQDFIIDLAGQRVTSDMSLRLELAHGGHGAPRMHLTTVQGNYSSACGSMYSNTDILVCDDPRPYPMRYYAAINRSQATTGTWANTFTASLSDSWVEPPAWSLLSDVPFLDVQGGSPTEHYFRMEVLPGTTRVEFRSRRSPGAPVDDAFVHMSVRRGARPLIDSPGLDDCSSASAGVDQTCYINNPAPGSYYVLLHSHDPSLFDVVGSLR